MAIEIHDDYIQFGDTKITETDTGISLGNKKLRTRGIVEYSPVQSSTVSGYTSAGSPNTNVIDKFPFSVDANATDVGDLTQGRYGVAGQSSTVSGYTSGGAWPYSNVIDKFPFSSDANATDVGDLTRVIIYLAGQSSTVSGYTSGGNGPSDTIDKFPFSTDANATDVGDLTEARQSPAGQQV
jgi:hypothetical protein